jgi:hypothetical protein
VPPPPVAYGLAAGFAVAVEGAVIPLSQTSSSSV